MPLKTCENVFLLSESVNRQVGTEKFRVRNTREDISRSNCFFRDNLSGLVVLQASFTCLLKLDRFSDLSPLLPLCLLCKQLELSEDSRLPVHLLLQTPHHRVLKVSGEVFDAENFARLPLYWLPVERPFERAFVVTTR